MATSKTFLLVVFAALIAAGSRNVAQAADPPKTIQLAVVVNAKNPVKKISFGELRAYLKMTRQMWPTGKRCDLYLPPPKSDAYRILLKLVYKKSHKKLQKYWIRKLFSGDIPSKPSHVPSAKAAATLVRKRIGALTVMPAAQAKAIGKGAKILPIDGKLAGDKGYRLVGIKPPRS